jgi:PAS domain S-box-containing protein
MILYQVAVSLLGYAHHSDLVGRNVNIIVPPPFSREHNSYVRNYIETGEAYHSTLRRMKNRWNAATTLINLLPMAGHVQEWDG